MGLTLDRGRYYIVLNVPNYLFGKVLGQSGQPVRQIRQALKTADLTVAKRRAFEIEELKRAEWALLECGEEARAYEKYVAAKKIAEGHGFVYMPISEILELPIEESIARIKALGPIDKLAPRPVVEALLGVVPRALPTLSQILDEYIELTKTKHIRKSDRQKHLWKLPRMRAVANFEVAVPGRKSSGIDEITREDALKFRSWWAARVNSGETRAETANKDFGHLSQLHHEWCELKGHTEFDNPFARLRFDKAVDPLVSRPAFSREWVAEKLLAEGALQGLNREAADALLVMVNTGLRPSEILSCPLEDFCLSEDIPFIRVAPNGRELKQRHTAREIPLLGTSLEATKRIVARGGIKRYQDKASHWSGLVNKYLANNGLKETSDHTAYSLRHYVEDMLLSAGVDDRVRADILGHKYQRPVYGSGGGLPMRRDALAKIAI